MSETSEHFARALARSRAAAGMSRLDLARAIGVSERTIERYEVGQHLPTPRRLRSLAETLECDPGELTGVVRGGETLADLRSAAGLSRADVADALRTGLTGRGMHLAVRTLSAIELGEPITARGWSGNEDLGSLVVALSRLYRVPSRMVLDAWMRSRPGGVAPRIPELPAKQPSKAALAAWQSLNERQQDYLTEVFAEERAVEQEVRLERARGVRETPQRWRRVTLAYRGEAEGVGRTRLQERLDQRGVHDAGTGSTIHALAKRDLVTVTEEELQHPLGGTLTRIGVELTRRGRAAVRAGTDTHGDLVPRHLLSEWLWGVVARVARAEPEGLPENDLSGRSLFYIAVGYKQRAGGRPSRGLIEAVPVHAPGGTHVLEYRWRLTQLGRHHVAEYLPTYRDRYPDVDTTALEAVADNPEMAGPPR